MIARKWSVYLLYKINKLLSYKLAKTLNYFKIQYIFLKIIDILVLLNYIIIESGLFYCADFYFN